MREVLPILLDDVSRCPASVTPPTSAFSTGVTGKLKLAWRRTLLQVPEMLFMLGCGLRKWETAVGWGVGWVPRATTGRFRIVFLGLSQ